MSRMATFGSPWIGIFPDDSAGPSQSDGEKQEMDPDISWIAEVCDDFAEHIEGGEMVRNCQMISKSRLYFEWL